MFGGRKWKVIPQRERWLLVGLTVVLMTPVLLVNSEGLRGILVGLILAAWIIASEFRARFHHQRARR